MSVVSGIVLCTSCCEIEANEDDPVILFEKINAWLKERQFGNLKRVEDHFGGNKHPQMFVAGAGFNNFPEDDFVSFFYSLQWENPENVVLIIEPEEGATKVYRPPSHS